MELISNQHVSNHKCNINTIEGVIQLYFQGIKTCLGVGVIREGFLKEVTFNCQEYRKDRRRM